MAQTTSGGVFCQKLFGTGRAPSNIANLDTLLQRSQDVGALGHKFLRSESGETGVQDRLHDCRIIQLLGFVDLRASWNAACVVVSDVLVVGLDGGDDIPLHDLHVVNIVEKLESFRTDLL